MSYVLTARVFELDIKSPTLRLVLLAVANRANDDTGICWPGQKTLAKDTSLTDRAVRTALAGLETLGFIARVRRQADGFKRQSDLIQVNLSLVAERPSGTVEEPPSGMNGFPSIAERPSGIVAERPSLSSGTSFRIEPIREPIKEREEGKKEKEKETREDALCLLSSDFESFWSIYPNKTKRLAAEKAFAKIQTIPNFVLADLMDGLKTYVAKADDRPWCNPDTWLKEHRWTDKPATVERTNGKLGWFERLRRSEEAGNERLRALGLPENGSSAGKLPDQPVYPRLSRSRP